MAKSNFKLSGLCLFVVMSLSCSYVFSSNAGGSNVSMGVDAMTEWGRSERFLAGSKKFITPGVLKKDQAVCSGGGRGQSYSTTCLPPPSNSYNRGCSKIYRCRSWVELSRVEFVFWVSPVLDEPSSAWRQWKIKNDIKIYVVICMQDE